MSDDKKNIVCIVGPTASGKSAYAVKIAKERGGEVVSCDSMQIYKRMDIGTAKITPEEMQGVPHHMIDVLEPFEPCSVYDFTCMARRCIDDILSRGALPVLCGGTGLYIDSIINNIEFSAAPRDDEYRTHLLNIAETRGSEAVYNMLKEIDADAAGATHPNNLNRVIRALEIYKTTGITKTEADKRSRRERVYNAEIIGLTLERGRLYERINKRVDLMMEQGLADEVKSLMQEGLPRDCTAMQAIGYKELVSYFLGECSFSDAVERIKQESRRYAKRQMTWFKRNEQIKWHFL